MIELSNIVAVNDKGELIISSESNFLTKEEIPLKGVATNEWENCFWFI